MAERPILIFPTPQSADRDTLHARSPETVQPSLSRQGERVAPQLHTLQQSFNERTVEIQQNAVGTDPSQVIVIETVGSIEDFSNAVSRIEGLEWLGEADIDEIAPDEDFYNKKKPEKLLRGRLYLVMSNQRAMDEMLSLWRRYQANPNMDWAYGTTKFKHVFDTLYDIRRWDVQDRLAETRVLEAWREDLEHYPEQPVRIEVELWFRSSEENRRSAESEVIALVSAVGGRILDRCVIPEIAYHSLLAELPRGQVEAMLSSERTELIQCDGVMSFRAVGQMATGKESIDLETWDGPTMAHPFPTGDPTIAVFDGLPLENHGLLADRLLIEDPEDFAPHYDVQHRVHGTAMCSLVVWGDLSDGAAPLARPVYARPIMKPVPWHNTPWPEEVPRDQLPIDLIHRAVRRLFEGEEGESPAAPTVKIINLSIGDPSRPFHQLMSPLARLLDWLSYKHGVLFVVSAGNYLQDIDIGMSESDFRILTGREREELVIRKLYEDARNRRIYAPAESMNSLTVNAVHQDGSGTPAVGRLVEGYTTPLPSPISSFGSGYRRAIKPDIAFPGGRVLYNYSPTGSTLSCYPKRSAPGMQVASPGNFPGENNKTSFGAGTSNAAAMISRTLGICHDSLLDLFEEQAEEIDPGPYVTSLLKTLAVHACSWDLTGDRLREILADRTDGHSVKHWISQWIGYGVPDVTRLVECTQQRATVLGFGQLNDGKGHVFQLPLPPSLGSKTDWRRLTITLGWITPIRPTTQKYRCADLWFSLPDRRLTSQRTHADHHAVRRGTVQHEVFEGQDALAISGGDTLTIKINCRKDAYRIPKSVPYGLAVSLEVAEGSAIPVYEEVQTRIRPDVEIRPRSPVMR